MLRPGLLHLSYLLPQKPYVLFPLNPIPPLPILRFGKLDLERVLPPALSRYGPFRLKHLRPEFHRLRLVTFGLDPFRPHVKDPRLLEDG